MGSGDGFDDRASGVYYGGVATFGDRGPTEPGGSRGPNGSTSFANSRSTTFGFSFSDGGEMPGVLRELHVQGVPEAFPFQALRPLRISDHYGAN